MTFAACSSGKPISQWGYSSWYHRSGVGAKAEWQRRKDRCLEQAAPDGDIEAVDERAFLSCMNGVNWCTKRYNCRRP